VTNEQLYLALGIPMVVNAGMIGLLLAHMGARFDALEKRFVGVDQRFDCLAQRFDHMRDLCIAELHRFEDVLVARLKRLEER